MFVYVIKRRGKWLTGHSYRTGVGYSDLWSSNPFEAWLYERAPTHVPDGGTVHRVAVSDQIAGLFTGTESRDG